MAVVAVCPSLGPGFLSGFPPLQNGTWLWPSAPLKVKASSAICQSDLGQLPTATVSLKIVPPQAEAHT